MKCSCLICMGSGSLVNARTDLQLTIISCTHTDCPTIWVSIIGTFFNHWWILQAPKAWAISGLWGNPQKFWNLDGLKQHFYCSERTISVKNVTKINHLSVKCLFMFAWPGFVYKYFILFYKYFFAQFFKVSWTSVSVNYTLIGVLVSSIVRIHLKNVKIGIFLSWSHIRYWSGFGIFKQNWENPDEIGRVGQSAHSTRWK